VRRYAEDVIGPKVREMDENEHMDPEIIKGLFENGVSCQEPDDYVYKLNK
jgi:short/branched chain acyl-CoA dehydrogenase